MGVVQIRKPAVEGHEETGANEPPRLREVLDVSASLFHEKGYRSTSLTDIAEALGMNKASLYHYVRSKEDLVRQLILRASKRLRDVSRNPEIDAMRPDEALERLLREHCAVLMDCPNELGLLIQQRKFVEPGVLLEISERERLYIAHVRSVIARGVAEGVFRPADISVTTSMITDVINGLLRWYRPDGRLSRDETVDAIWAFVSGALAPVALKRKPRGR